MRITISGLPAGAVAKAYLCPAELRDSLLKQVSGQWVPNNDLTTRVSTYCGTAFNDSLTGAVSGFPVTTSRPRSATTGDIVFDAPVPRGTSTPTYVLNDPDYTTRNPNTDPAKGPILTWPNNPVIGKDPTTGTEIHEKQWSFPCDETHPCRVMLTIIAKNAEGKSVTWTDASLPTIAPTVPEVAVKGCAGLGVNTLNASLPQRVGRSAVAWNQVLCAPTKSEQPTNIVSEDEDLALKSFDTGTSDLAFTGSGSTLAPQTVRTRQYVPVGINATVLATVGWSPSDKADNGSALKSKVADTFSVTLDEFANMLTKGGQNPDTDGRGGVFKDASPLVARNPAMKAVNGSVPNLNPGARAGSLDAGNGYFGLTGEAGKGTVPLTASTVLARDAAGAWVFRKMTDIRYYGDLDGKSPGVITDLNQLDPGTIRLNNADAKVGQSAVRKVVDGVTVGKDNNLCLKGCLNWVVTDLATARAYGWTPVALPDGKGGFVTPSEQSLQAAADSMTEGADGTLQPGTAKAGYPLTFVEYLAVPLNPLIDKDCKPLQGKQDTLKKFVRMAQSRGQAVMAPGLARITPSLAGVALDRTDQIGTGTPEKACQEKDDSQHPPPPGTGTPPPSAPGPDTPGGGTTAASNPETAPAGATAPVHNAVPTPQSVQAAKNVADVTRIPPFAGAGVLGALIPLLALVILAVLPSATALVTAGRPVPRWLTRIAEAVLGLFARLRGGRA